MKKLLPRVLLAKMCWSSKSEALRKLLRYFKNWEDVLVNNLAEIDQIKTKSVFIHVIIVLEHIFEGKSFASNIKYEAAILPTQNF